MSRKIFWSIPQKDTLKELKLYCCHAIEENSKQGKQVEDILLYKHEIFVKFTYCIMTIEKLYEGYTEKYENKNIKIIDYSSIIVLIRAAFETFLQYYYIYHDSNNNEEISYRFMCWFIDGMNQRQLYETKKAEHQDKVRSEQALINNIIEKIKETDVYKNLSKEQKNDLITQKRFRRPSWSSIAEKVGFDKVWMKEIYQFYSTYSHTSSSSILQFKGFRKDGYDIISYIITHLFSFTSLFLDYYCKDFNIRNDLVAENNELIEAWIFFAREFKK